MACFTSPFEDYASLSLCKTLWVLRLFIEWILMDSPSELLFCFCIWLRGHIMERVSDSSKPSVGLCCLCCCAHFSDLMQLQRWCSGRPLCRIPLASALVLLSALKYLLYTQGAFRRCQPPAPHPPLPPLWTRTHIKPGPVSVTDVVLYKPHTLGRESCCLYDRNRIFWQYILRRHSKIHNVSECCCGLSCAMVMRAEAFGSYTHTWAPSRALQISSGFSPPNMDGVCTLHFWFAAVINLKWRIVMTCKYHPIHVSFSQPLWFANSSWAHLCRQRRGLFSSPWALCLRRLF